MRYAILGATLLLIHTSIVAAAAPGSGTATITPPDDVTAGTLGTWSITFTPSVSDTFLNGTIRVTIPADWTAPQPGPPGNPPPGYVTVSSDTVVANPNLSVSGQQITISIDALPYPKSVTLVYGSGGGQAAAQVPTTARTDTFLVESDPTGTSVSPIASSPELTVVAVPSKLVFLNSPFTFESTGEAGPFTVEAQDTFGNPTAMTADQQIDLSSDSTSGVFSATSGGIPVSSVTMSLGTSQVSFYYRDTKVGTPTLTAHAQGQSWTDATQAQTVTPGPEAELVIAPQDPTITAGDFMQFQLMLKDDNGNPTTASSPVVLTLSSSPNGDFYTTVDHVTPIPDVTIPAGVGTLMVDYRNTDANGGVPHNVFIYNLESVFSIEPTAASLFATTTVTVNPAAVNLAVSTLDGTTPVVADGVASSLVTVTMTDTFLNPVSGVNVTLTTPGSSTTNITNPPSTGSSGTVQGSVSNTKAEQVTVKGQVGVQTMVDTAVIDFIPGPVSADSSLVDAVPDSVVADGSTTSTITVTARDAQGNPIQGLAVVLSIDPPGGGANLIQPDTLTGLNGQTAGTLSSTTTGPRVVHATFDGVAVSDTAEVIFTPGAAAAFVWSFTGGAMAGTPKDVTLRARDAENNLITNYADTVFLSTTASVPVSWGAQGGASNAPDSLPGGQWFYLFDPADGGNVPLRVTATKVESITLSAARGSASGTSNALSVDHGAATTLVEVSGNGQTATVNTAVAQNLVVRVEDDFGNPVDGDSVTFGMVTGGGGVEISGGGSADTVATSNGIGEATATVWTLGQTAGTDNNSVTASISAGPSVVFTASGTAGTGTGIAITPLTASVAVDDTLLVKAVLTDDFDNPVSGKLVTVLIKSPADGTLEDDPAHPTTPAGSTVRQGTTDAEGAVYVYYHSPGTAGLVDNVDASGDGATADVVPDATYTSVADSVATTLRLDLQGTTTSPAGQGFAMLIEALDGSQNLVATDTSTVLLSADGGNFEFSLTSDFAALVTQAKLAGGQRMVYARAKLEGDWTITVDDIASPILTSGTGDVTITDTGVIESYFVSTVGSVTAGATFNVSITALDTFGNLVDGAGNAITLAAVSAADSLVVLPDPLQVTNSALVSGQATVPETYPRAVDIRVRVRDGSSKEGYSGTVTVNPAAAYQIVQVSGDSTGVVAGTTAPLTARVLDQFGNKVPGEEVDFEVLPPGGGNVVPDPDVTDADGLVTVTLTTGSKAGENRVRAQIDDGSPSNLERIEFVVQTDPSSGIAYLTITPSATTFTAGDSINVTVQAFDAGNNLITTDNTTVIDLGSTTGNATFSQASGTLTGGIFTTKMTNTTAEPFAATAEVQGGGFPTQTATITALPDVAYEIVKVSNDTTGVVVGDSVDLIVVVNDTFANPVPNQAVIFSIQNPIDGTAFASPQVVPNTDANGRAQTKLHTAQTVGTNELLARIDDGLPANLETKVFQVGTKAGDIAYFDVTASTSTGTAGVGLLLTVAAYDASDNPITDDNSTVIDFSLLQGSGTFSVDNVPLAAGSLQTTVTDTVAGNLQVRAAGGGAQGDSPVIQIVPDVPAGTITVASIAPNDTITADSVSTTTITTDPITDQYANTVPSGTMITVATTLGSIVNSDQDPVTIGIQLPTNPSGTIAVQVRSSSTPGTASVTMQSVTGSASGAQAIVFAAPAGFICPEPPIPSTVKPAESVAFKAVVQSTSATAATIQAGTTFRFSDGTNNFVAPLSAPVFLPGGSSDTLTFTSTTVASSFAPGDYQPVIDILAIDIYGSPTSEACVVGGTVKVSAIHITGIVPSQTIVSRGSSYTVTVSVMNDGPDDVIIDDITLNFGGGSYSSITPTTLPDTILSGLTKAMPVDVTIAVGSATGTFTIDAQVSGTVNGVPVSDPTFLPDTLPTWEIQTAADLDYVAGTLTPGIVSRGQTQAISLNLTNNGSATVELNTGSTVSFTDGVRTYTANLSGTTAIAGGETRTFSFDAAVVDGAFTPGSYDVEVDLQGLENGAPFAQIVNTSPDDSMSVVTPAVLSPHANSLDPDQVSASTSVAFQVGFDNSGGASFVLNPDSTRIQFSSFDATLDGNFATVIGPGANNTLLTFESRVVNVAPATYNPTVMLIGTENGIRRQVGPVVLTDVLTVQQAPDISITSIRPSQSPITADQAGSFDVWMKVQNSGGATVQFDTASVRLFLGGSPKTDQFDITPPGGFHNGGSTLAGGATDSTLFVVKDDTLNAMSTGTMTIEGALTVIDPNGPTVITTNTDAGGKGTLVVQSPAVLKILSILPSQDPVTAGQTKAFTIPMAVHNQGGSDVTVDLDRANTFLTFSQPGWAWTLRDTLAGGGNVLGDGETGTVVFDVNGAGTIAGPVTIDGDIEATEQNSGRLVTDNTSDSGSGSIEVQLPASIVVNSITPSQPSVTQGTAAPWSIKVVLTNAGDADALLDMGALIAVAFQNQVVPSTFVKPSSLDGSGTATLAGGDTDSFVVQVGPTGTVSSPGTKSITVALTGTDANADSTVSAVSGIGSVDFDLPPTLAYVGGSLAPPNVSRGAVVGFTVDVVNSLNSSTVQLDRALTQLRFGGGLYNVGLDASSPILIGDGETVTLQFSSAQISPLLPLGDQAVELTLVGTENGNGFTPPVIALPSGQLSVVDAPRLNITQLIPRPRNTVTQSQTQDWEIAMVLQNTGGDVQLDLSDTATYVSFMSGGTDVSGEYGVTPPAALEIAGGSVLGSGLTDTLVFTVDASGSTLGTIVINGQVEGNDVLPPNDPVTDNTFDGGSTTITVQTPAVLEITGITNSQPTVTASQTQTWQANVALKNNGDAAIQLDLGAAANMTFASGPTWTPVARGTLEGGGTVLAGGETGVLVFDVTETGAAGASVRIDASINGTEINRGTPVSDSTDTSGFGSINVQTPADLGTPVVSTSVPSVTAGSSVPWFVYVDVTNNGESAVTVDFGSQTRIEFPQGTGFTIEPVTTFDDGTASLTASQTKRIEYTVSQTGTVTGGPTTPIDAIVRFTEDNSARVDSATASGSVDVQDAPALTYEPDSVEPDTVTMGGSAAFRVKINNTVASAATVVLDRDATHMSFGGGAYDVTLDPASPVSIPGGAQAELLFRPGNANVPVGTYDFNLTLVGTQNGNPVNVPLTVVGELDIIVPPQLAINRVRPSQTTVTAGQDTSWTITMVIENNGNVAVDVDTAAARTYIEFRRQGGTVMTDYEVLQPTQLETQGNFLLPAYGQDSLVFTVTKTGATAGLVSLIGHVGGDEVGSGSPVTDDAVGEFVQVQEPGSLVVKSIEPSQPTATQGQGGWQVVVMVENTGGSEIELYADADSTLLTYAPDDPDWSHDPPTLSLVSASGPIAIKGGEEKSIIFPITQTGNTTGTTAIGAEVRGVQLNDGVRKFAASTPATEASVVVQTPATLDITKVVLSRDPVTNGSGQTTPWTVAVDVTNSGEALIKLSYVSANTYVQFPDATGGSVGQPSGSDTLSGDSTKTLTFTVNQTPTFPPPPGPHPIDVQVIGVEANRAQQLNPADTTTYVTVNDFPVVEYVPGSLYPSGITQGSPVSFKIDVTMPSGMATVELDNTTRFILSDTTGHSIQPILSSLGDQTIVAGDTAQIQFESVTMPPAFTPSAFPPVVQLRGTQNGNPGFNQDFSPLPDSVTVGEISQVEILSLNPSQGTVTRGQSRPWTVAMRVHNYGPGSVDLIPSLTELTFKEGTTDVTGEYQVDWDSTFAGGGTQLLLDQEDDIIFTINSTGSTKGEVRIDGLVTMKDATGNIDDDTFDGGFATVQVQDSSQLVVTRIRPSQSTATKNQTAPWDAWVVVQNAGEADVKVDFPLQPITFPLASGFGVNVPPNFSGAASADSILSAGQIDSLQFTVSPTGQPTGTRTIHAVVTGVELNDSTFQKWDTQVDGNAGSIIVQTPPQLIVQTTTLVAPNAPNVNTDQLFGVHVQIRNDGEAAADTVSYRIVPSGGSTPQGSDIIVAPSIAGGATRIDTFRVQAGSTEDSDTMRIEVIEGFDANTGDTTTVVIGPHVDTTAVATIQNPSALNVTDVTPSRATVTQNQSQHWYVDVAVRNDGTADLQLDPPGLGDIEFTLGGPPLAGYTVDFPDTFVSGDSTLRLAGGANDTLRYTVRQTGPDVGLVTITATIGGYDVNDPDSTRSGGNTGSVIVQSQSGLFIQTTREDPATAPNSVGPNTVQVNSGWSFKVEVTVQNSGEDVKDVTVFLDSDGLATTPPESAPITIDQDSSATLVFDVTAETLPAAVNSRTEVLSAAITNAVSVNTGDPIEPGTAVDATQTLVTQKPADLQVSLDITGPAGALDGTVAVGQSFTVQAEVTNAGVGEVDDTSAQLRLTLPAGWNTPTPPETQLFTVGTPVVWNVSRDSVASNDTLTATIDIVPIDKNTGDPAAVSQTSASVVVDVLETAQFNNPTLVIESPSGATDDTVSTRQTFVARATVQAEPTMNNIRAILELAPASGLTPTTNDTVDLGNGDGGTKTANFTLRAPLGPRSDDFNVLFEGIDENTTSTVTVRTDTLTVQTVPAAQLTLTAVIVTKEAQDNVVSLGTPFTIKAVVENAPGSAGVDSTMLKPRIEMTLPAGYTFCPGPSKQAFSVGDSVSWTVCAPMVESGPENITIEVTSLPADENSGLEPPITGTPVNIPIQTVSFNVSLANVSSQAGIGTKVVPRGAQNIDMLAIDVMNPGGASDSVVIRGMDVTLLDQTGAQTSPSANLTEFYATIGGQRVNATLGQNPMHLQIDSAGSAAGVGTGGSARIVLTLSVSGSAPASQLVIAVLDTPNVFIESVLSGERTPLLAEDFAADRLHSQPLVLMSNNFEEYAHNYPNPFRAGEELTRIAYNMESGGSVSIKVYTLTGDKVWEKEFQSNEPQAQPGAREVTWDGRNMKGELVRNGVYVCRIEAAGQTATFKIAVAK